VVTHDSSRNSTSGSTAPTTAAKGSYWTHNGSRLRLEANGAERRFVYDLPRRGMLDAGANPGDAVFEGRREGATYSGTAYVLSKACGRVGYQVAGNISADERSVVVEGQVPLHGPGCSVRAYRRDVLRFDLLEP
ncbi:MAG: hypothetical protein AB7F78_04715, partial [Hyphomicrobiaceae bacterium]